MGAGKRREEKRREEKRREERREEKLSLSPGCVKDCEGICE